MTYKLNTLRNIDFIVFWILVDSILSCEIHRTDIFQAFIRSNTQHCTFDKISYHVDSER